MPQVDPKFTFYFGLWTNVLAFIAGVSVDHAPQMIAQYAPSVQWFLSNFVQINGIILTALVGVSSNKPGPLISVPASSAKPIVIVALVLAGMLAFSGDAHAQSGIKVRLPDPLKLNQQSPAADSAPSGLAKFMSDLAALKEEVVNGTVADLQAADADASTLTNSADPTSFRDPIAHACYPAAVKFLQQLPAASAPTGTFVAVQMFQKKRDFVMQIQAGLPVYLKLGCAPLLGDEAAIFTKVMGLVGLKVGLSTLIPGAGTLAGLSF